MAFTFDSLAFAKMLRDAGVPAQQAEAHAEAARTFIMNELATKADLHSTVQHAVALLDAKIEAQTLRLTVRLGVMLAATIAILTSLQKLG
jgi:hypothetical protein